METGWRDSFSGSDGGDGAGGVSGGQNGNFTSNAWDIWDNSTTTGTTVTPHAGSSTHYDWTSPAISAADTIEEASVVHALLFSVTNNNTAFHHVRDPHMMCLKLGKRHYYEDTSFVPDNHVTTVRDKRGKLQYPYDTVTPAATTRWPMRVTSATRCRVEGCNVALGNAKEYYKRHKVCEIHSKAPKVVVSGFQQRFCQQCSRFHDIIEFDEAKRSCRRRLEGHNLRRRKGVISNSLTRNFPLSHENSSAMEQRLGPLSPSSSQSKPIRALSLLSTPKAEPWISSGDLSSRCSAALYELIAANRATYVSGHLLNQYSSHQQILDSTMHALHDTNQFSHSTMTFDAKQAPPLDFGLLAMKEKSKDPEEWTDCCWSAFGGANVV